MLTITRLGLALLLLVWSAVAQRRSMSGRAHDQVARPGTTHNGAAGNLPYQRYPNRNYPYGVGGYGLPGYYGDAGCGTPEPEYSQQESTPEPSASVPLQPVASEPAPEPMLLELRGSQWVQVNNIGQGAQKLAGTQTSPQPAPRLKDVPPAILVYLDGRTEQVVSYSIIGDTIYVKSDYWNTGVWTRAIQISTLDIPTTLRRNQDSGTHFQLPSGPSEVVIRP